jgi:FMN phosphatase YigB (HAD superfamily)
VAKQKFSRIMRSKTNQHSNFISLKRSRRDIQLSRRKPVFIFDIGGVVIIWRNNDPIFRYIAKRYRIPFSKARVIMIKNLAEFESAKINCREFVRRSLAHFGKKLRRRDDPTALIILPFERGAKTRKGLLEIILGLERRGYEVDGFSNTNNIHARFMKQKGWTTIFHRFFASPYLRAMKPHLNAYRKVLAKIHAKPHDVIFVDNTRENILGAKKAGIKHSIWFHSITDLKKGIKRVLYEFERNGLSTHLGSQNR